MAHESPGLYNDALIYESVLEKYFDVKILLPKDKLDGINMLKNNIADIYFFLEIIYDINIYDENYKKKLILFMPNQELYRDKFELNIVNIVLCKTIIAKEMFSSMKTKFGYNYEIIYTKFTTYIPQDLKDYPIVKNKNLFISFAGKSPFKNIDILVNMWIKNNGFLHIDSDIKLVITCYTSCFRNFVKNMIRNFKIKFIRLNNNIFRYKNLILYNLKLESNDYKKYITSANCAICISRKEGYGHYINEARYFNTFILSVNHPPMNELVFDGKNGTLVKVEKKTIVNNYNYQLYDVYPEYDDFKEKLIKTIKNKDNLYISGNIGKKLYEEDKQFFGETMKNNVVPLMNKIIINLNK